MRFDSYHPVINLIYFAAAIGLTIWFNHPVFVLLSYLCAFAYSVKLKGRKALIFNLCLLIPMAIYTWWYSYYNHFGVTVIGQNFTGNSITAEAVFYGLERAVTVGAVIIFLSCFLTIFSSDKVVYVFGRISPKLSLFLSVILRTVPRVKKYAGKINVAQKGVGRGSSQGNFFVRLRNSLRILSVLITWTLENFVESSQSMKSRGYSLKGRTAFSIYRFDNRDRAFVIGIFALLTIIMIAWGLDQTHIYYDPQIIMMPLTLLSFVFYLAYGVLLLLPMILQIVGERRFEKLRDVCYSTEIK